LGVEWTSVGVRDERVGVDRFAVMDRDDQIDVAGPRAFRVEPRRLRRVVGVTVVVADDVQPRGVGLALDADVVSRIDLVAIARPLHDDVARAFDLAYRALIVRADHDAADLARVALSPVGAYRVESLLPDLHFMRPYSPVER